MHPIIQAHLDLSQSELDFQLSPSKSAKDAMGSLSAMMEATTNAQNDPTMNVVTDVRYGARPRQLMDIYRPAAVNEAKRPCFVFIHGGFWQEGGKEVSGFAARTFAKLGWAYVAIGYTLTPDVTLTDIVAEIDQSLAHLVKNADAYHIDPKTIVLAGHSAGGHLAACVICNVLRGKPSYSIAGAVVVSGVFDLEPIAASYVNNLARISPTEVSALSPLRFTPVHKSPVHILIGADEPAAFQGQSTALIETWRALDCPISIHRAAGRDHFDVLDEFNDPASKSIEAVLSMRPTETD